MATQATRKPTSTIPLLVQFRQVDSFPGRFEWDEPKAEANVAKHKIGFESAAKVFDDPNIVSDEGPDL